MSKKDIIIVINSLSQGGAERVTSILLERYYHDSNYEVELVLLEDEIAYPLPEGVKVTILSSLNNSDSSVKKTLFIPLLAYKLQQFVKARNPDLIVSFLYRADFVNILASWMHKKPVIVSERVNASSTYNNSSLNAKINKFLIKTLYPQAKMVINVSEGTKEDLVDNFHISKEKQCVIYNPYDSEKIQSLSNAPIDIKLEKEKTIVAVSRFRPIKNIEMMLRAFAKVKEESCLVLVGDGSDEAKLHALAEELEIKDKVIFVGGQDNPYKYLSKASIYLSTSRSEGFPNAMVEAMICGCAIISTDCPSGPREILAPDSDIRKQMQTGVEYAKFGTLLALDDINALSLALSHLLTSRDSREVYSQKAKQRAEDFQLERIYQEYCDVFNFVIEGNSR